MEHNKKFLDKLNWYNIKNPEKYFESGVIISKVIFLITLLLLAFLNVDTTFLVDHPRIFLTETLLTALFSAIPAILIAYNRGLSKTQIFNTAYITFLFFFAFNSLTEFAGLNANKNPIKQPTDNTEDSKKNNQVNTSANTLSMKLPIIKPVANQTQLDNINKIESQYWLRGVIFVVGIGMLYLALITHDFPKKLTWVILLVEIIIFSILNTIPKSIIAYNRNSDVTKITRSSLVFYIVVYLVLQSGGFFTPTSEINLDISLSKV